LAKKMLLPYQSAISSPAVGLSRDLSLAEVGIEGPNQAQDLNPIAATETTEPIPNITSSEHVTTDLTISFSTRASSSIETAMTDASTMPFPTRPSSSIKTAMTDPTIAVPFPTSPSSSIESAMTDSLTMPFPTSPSSSIEIAMTDSLTMPSPTSSSSYIETAMTDPTSTMLSSTSSSSSIEKGMTMTITIVSTSSSGSAGSLSTQTNIDSKVHHTTNLIPILAPLLAAIVVLSTSIIVAIILRKRRNRNLGVSVSTRITAFSQSFQVEPGSIPPISSDNDTTQDNLVSERAASNVSYSKTPPPAYNHASLDLLAPSELYVED